MPSGSSVDAIQLAIDAATDGDVVLVEEGVYRGFTIEDKAISVIADVPLDVVVMNPVRIRDLAPQRAVLLHGLFVPSDGIALELDDCAGSIRLQDCDFRGRNNADSGTSVVCSSEGDGSGTLALSVKNCQDVALSRCVVMGGRGFNAVGGASGGPCPNGAPGGNGALGISSSNSRLALHASFVQGGAGGKGGGGGGVGWRAVYGPEFRGIGSFASGTTVFGGPGGPPNQTPSGNGGIGITHFGASLTMLAGGAFGGVGGSSSGTTGLPQAGEPIVQLTGPARTLELNCPVREHESAFVEFDGAPFDFALLAVATGGAHAPMPPFIGVLLTTSPSLIPLGSAGATGSKNVLMDVGALPSGTSLLQAHVQAAAISPTFEVVLADPRALVILDESL